MTQIDMSQSSIGTDARPLPSLYISVLAVGIRDLALRFANYFRAFPESPLDVLAEEILQTFGIMQQSQSRTVRLAFDFGSELLRHRAELLVQDISARFGHMQNIDPAAILTYVVDELGIWVRQSLIHRQDAGIIDDDDDE